MVSPTLDFSRASKASVFYKLSYATRSLSANAEKFKILSSKDCGITFDKVLVDQSSVNFAVKESADPWVPESDLDWKQQFLDLDSLLGSKEGRIAFVVTNDNGNNLYIDDIEFFTDDDPNPLTISSLYTIYNRPLDFKITFNLPEREDVRLQIYNAMGQIVVDNQLPETLNQTYDVDLTGQASGVYIVRMQIGNQLTATKVFIGHF